MSSLIWPVILSGGAGTRLWPLSLPARPKQFLAFTGAQTMLQETVARTAGPGFHPPILVCGAAHTGLIDTQLNEIGITPAAVIVEPAARNTAPAIALAALEVVQRDPAGILLVMPSDHVIDRPTALLAAVARATPVVANGWLATFGIAPTGPETGYGYIERGEPLATGVDRAVRFVEKPPLADADAMLSTGRFAWNGGLFLLRADAFLDALAEHATEVLAAARAAFAAATRDGVLIHPDAASFAAAPSISVDYAVMEKAARVAVVPVDMGWSDIGSWQAVHGHGPADGDGNVIRGPAVLIDTRDTLVRSDGPLVATLGVEGLVIVVTAGAVLVADAARSQEVKAIVARLPAG